MSVCVCNLCLSYSACKYHLSCAASYCHLWPLSLYHFLSHYLLNGIIFVNKKKNKKKKKNLEHKMCVLIFSTNFPEIFLILQKNSATYYHKFMSSCKAQVPNLCFPGSPRLLQENK